jgi:hypothetical protein
MKPEIARYTPTYVNTGYFLAPNDRSNNTRANIVPHIYTFLDAINPSTKHERIAMVNISTNATDENTIEVR